MTPMTTVAAGTLIPAHAADLAELVEHEARWENLRAATSRTAAVRSTTQDLHGMQKAYEAYRVRLAAYNKHYAPGHLPELLLNTPLRLRIWCRRMRDLFLQVEDDPRLRLPIEVLAKAYRWADRIADRTGKVCPLRSSPPADFRTAFQLEALGQWCDELAGVEPGASQL